MDADIVAKGSGVAVVVTGDEASEHEGEDEVVGDGGKGGGGGGGGGGDLSLLRVVRSKTCGKDIL